MELEQSHITTKHLTPLMQQYADIKNSYLDALVLFQVGDFYELFFEDAKQAAAFLGIALTKRGHIQGEPIPLCGVPVHALDHYLVKLVRGGFKVVICDQLEPAVAGKVVDRGVTRVLTPGTLTDDKLLDAKSSSYLFSFFPADDQWGLLFGELLTAQLFATMLPHNSYKMLETELSRFFPDEVLLPITAKSYQPYFKQQGYFTTLVNDITDHDELAGATRGWMSRQFKKEQVVPLEGNASVRNALYGFYSYLKRTQESSLEQFRTIHFYKPEDFLMLDAATQKNLELLKSQDGSTQHTLFSFMDRASTPMGSRAIKKWIMRPLVKQDAIEQRLDVVEHFTHDLGAMQLLERLLRMIGDIERVVGRIALRRAHLHDYVMLCQTLQTIPEIKILLERSASTFLLNLLNNKLNDFSALHDLLAQSLNDDSAHEWIIKKGFSKDLDHLRELVHNSQSKILELELQEQQKTGIQSLKIRFNNIQGYYFEVTKANLELVPDYFVRQQSLVGRERFMTPELKSLQAEIISAQNRIGAAEAEIFERIKNEVFEHLFSLRHMAQALAQLDALLSLSLLAYDNNFVRPEFNQENNIIIKDGRHPIVADIIKHHYIPNDTALTQEQSLWVITGPNMGGKSTFMRQNALVCIMAQCGSYVPAKSANLSILDRIFTRIGAGDNVAQGKSTFLTEMEETALICTKATRHSLVILDEVGRGTSTFDGLSIAQAVVEFIHTQIGARCLFATHYHELTALEHKFPGIVCYYAASKKTDSGIMFLYKILKGTAHGSFGIDVAHLAGLPQSIIARAQNILAHLENHEHVNAIISDDTSQTTIHALQHELESKNALAQKIDTIDFDNLTPKQAFDILWSLKNK